MLISVKENVFKKEVEIKFNNITEGFNRYKNKTISAINEENFERGMICFLQEAVKLNGLNSSYVDFYYNSLSEEDKVKLVEMVSVDDRKFIESFKEKNTTGGIYYYLTLDSVPFISRLNSNEILFSSIYFTKEECTIWGNYNKRFPIFYKEEHVLMKYVDIANKYGLIID
ncbi:MULTISPECIES: hypothetical protein [Clostridium]|uniref:hypothetical protein n=1 Tax=Clostridium TaxID=1485 RepID=UPI000821F548|nr:MULTISPECIES: hypothetical protein [Clostridium]MBX9183590.1 hypothetical protein [Clostridium sp. K04]MDU7454014.1 hypothetical protein [Clostridium saudiense]SCJ94050.1 Uncharacterised protein [uncultured Clostridium sp.]